MQLLGPALPYGTVSGSPRLDGKTFIVFYYIWQEDVAIIPKVLWDPRKVNPARAITWLVSVTSYCTIFQYRFISKSAVFTQKNTFEKKLAKRNAY